MYVLGINEGHIASASIIRDGEITAAASEERFTREKGTAGFPVQAIQWCLAEAGITIADVEMVVFGAKYTAAAVWYKKNIRLPEVFFYRIRTLFQGIRPLFVLLHRRQVAQKLGISERKIYFLDHHSAHAWAAIGIHGSAKKQLIITNDGAGDDTSGKVFIAQNGRLREIASTPNHYSPAYLYYYVTKFLGFTPDQDEYKVMGLAGYADRERVDRIYPFFGRLFHLAGLSFRSVIKRASYFPYLRSNLAGRRFDDIAGAVQRLTETLVVSQLRAALKKTRISTVLFGGGLYMNVKANMKAAQVNGLRTLFICPSPGDESVAVGAAYWGYHQWCMKTHTTWRPIPAQNLYLGPTCDPADVRTASLIRVRKLDKDKIPRIIASLLVKGEIVARASGKMEFGARALGNRSILADPRNPALIRVINKQIKNRDFWMPFAPTILDGSVKKYLINPKGIHSPFMMVAYDTTSKARKDIPAAIHPYDFTCRPQILKREQNPEYYGIIKEFERITGVGAVLNTSFNLHGEPIVCSSADAMSTFKRSGLKYLLLDQVLIEKLYL